MHVFWRYKLSRRGSRNFSRGGGGFLKKKNEIFLDLFFRSTKLIFWALPNHYQGTILTKFSAPQKLFLDQQFLWKYMGSGCFIIIFITFSDFFETLWNFFSLLQDCFSQKLLRFLKKGTNGKSANCSVCLHSYWVSFYLSAFEKLPYQIWDFGFSG